MWTYVFISLGYIFRSGIAGSYGNSMFSILRDCQTVFQSNHTIFRRKQWHPTPVLLPGKSHGRRSLVGYSPWGHEESDMTERLHFHFSLSCIGEGNGNPFQCSCLENPRDGGAWWAAVYGVAQSRTQLKWLSSIPFSFLAAVSEVSSFCTPLPTVVIVCLLMRAILVVVKWYLIVFICNSPSWLMVLNIFHVFIGHCKSLSLLC